jgi:hypothetical protein
MELSKFLNRGRYRVIDSKKLNQNEVGVLAYERHISGQEDEKPYVVLSAKKIDDLYHISDYGQHFATKSEARNQFSDME